MRSGVTGRGAVPKPCLEADDPGDLPSLCCIKREVSAGGAADEEEEEKPAAEDARHAAKSADPMTCSSAL